MPIWDGLECVEGELGMGDASLSAVRGVSKIKQRRELGSGGNRLNAEAEMAEMESGAMVPRCS